MSDWSSSVTSLLKQVPILLFRALNTITNFLLVKLTHSAIFAINSLIPELEDTQVSQRLNNVNNLTDDIEKMSRTIDNTIKYDEEANEKEIGFVAPFNNLSDGTMLTLFRERLQKYFGPKSGNQSTCPDNCKGGETAIHKRGLNCSGHELFENALSSSFIKVEDFMDESKDYAKTPSTAIENPKNFRSRSSNSLNSLGNPSSVLPFEHIWIAQLCTWLHARGLQHYGAIFPNLFTNKVFTLSKKNFIDECGPIDGPHIYDTIQLLHWLHRNSFGHLWHQLAGFSFKDLTFLSKKALTNMCGREDAQRLIHALKIKLTIYCALDFNESDAHIWKIVCLRTMTVDELCRELSRKFDISQKPINRIKIVESLGIHILLDDDLLSSIKDGTEYLIQLSTSKKTGCQDLLMRPFCG